MPGHDFQQRRDERIVVGFTGRIGAGKTSAAKHLGEAHGFFYIRYSQVLSDWLVNDPESKAHLQRIGWEVMAGGMQAELNRRLIARIPDGRDCAVDGLRHPLDYQSLSEAFPSWFKLIYIDSFERLRWARLIRTDRTLEEVRRADSHAVEQQIDSLREKAFAVIDNNGSLRELYSKVDSLLQHMRRGGHE